jgi:hypothetical protein
MNKRSRSQRNETYFSENNSESKKKHNLRSLNGKTPISKDEFEHEEDYSDFSNDEDEAPFKLQKVNFSKNI